MPTQSLAASQESRRQRHQTDKHHQHPPVWLSRFSLNDRPSWSRYSHHDHAGGNTQILKSYPLPIIGGKDCEKVNKTPAHGETFTIGENIKVKAFHTPCHTQDSICFFFEDGDDRAVFTGDTLFIGGNFDWSQSISDKYWLSAGCGRFFEGNAEEMDKALNETLAALPDDTKVYVSEIRIRFYDCIYWLDHSLVMSTRRATLNLASRSCSQSLSRSSRLSPMRTNRHRANSLLVMKR
jgi:hypothetical protein